MSLFLNPEIWMGLLTLTVLEVILGVDNLVFISVMTNRLPAAQQKRARQIGLMLACISRLLLLGIIAWIAKLTFPLFSMFSQSFSWRDLILIGGGLFLLAKGTSEIHIDVSGHEEEIKLKRYASFTSIVLQIMVLDIIFSLDSVITAVGMVQEVIVMAMAIITAVALMLFASEPLSHFIQKYPTLKMLALSFLLLVGVVLIADGFKFHIPREYVYFAMAFSVFVEILNILARNKRRKNKS